MEFAHAYFRSSVLRDAAALYFRARALSPPDVCIELCRLYGGDVARACVIREGKYEEEKVKYVSRRASSLHHFHLAFSASDPAERPTSARSCRCV